MTIQVATCQFPVDADIRRNARYVLRQMRAAKGRGAHVVHFPEAGLSGYAGSDLESLEGFDWRLLEECTHRLIELFAPRLVLEISDELSSTGDIERIRLVGRIVEEYNAQFDSNPQDRS